MNLFELVLVAVAAAVVIAYVATYLTRVVKDDGAHGARRTPPRSHHCRLVRPTLPPRLSPCPGHAEGPGHHHW